MGRRQFIAIDGSDQAQYAFDWYLSSFHKDGDLVILANVAEYNINMGMPGTHDVKTINEICEAVKKRNDEISNLTDTFMNTLRTKKIEGKVVHLSSSKPGEALLQSAEDEKVDHIIVGTRGLGKIRRTLLGSVSEYIVHHAHVPVSVIRKPQE